MSGVEQEVDSNELAAFVSSTLIAISQGVHAAQASGAVSSAYKRGEFGFSAPREVEFDIAATARKGDKTGGGLKVEVFSIGANARGEESREHSSVNRIRFTIPTIFREFEKRSENEDGNEESNV